MTKEDFKLTLASSHPPPDIDDHLAALWYDAKGDWEKSHQTIQDIPGPKAAWIHAYLHRKEGDLGNAGYWYNLARRRMTQVELEKEWDDILTGLLDSQ
jgi:hypothetical protein